MATFGVSIEHIQDANGTMVTRISEDSVNPALKRLHHNTVTAINGITGDYEALSRALIVGGKKGVINITFEGEKNITLKPIGLALRFKFLLATILAGKYPLNSHSNREDGWEVSDEQLRKA